MIGDKSDGSPIDKMLRDKGIVKKRNVRDVGSLTLMAVQKPGWPDPVNSGQLKQDRAG